MIEVTIHYMVPDRKGQSFKEINDIVKDVERELWESNYFSECYVYSIEVDDGSTKMFLSHKKEEQQ